MPFVTDYAPISAALALGTIAGTGRGLAEQKARQLQQQMQDQAMAVQIAQENIRNTVAARQSQQQQQAQTHANDIQTALAYSKLNQDRELQQQQLAQQQAQTQAQNIRYNAEAAQSAGQQQERTRQFDAELGLKKQGQEFQQKKYNEAQQQEAQKDAEVYQQIDQIAPPGSSENIRLRTLYRANGRIQAPTTVNPAQSLSVVNTRIKAITDPLLGGPLEGHEEEFARLSQIAQQIAQTIGGNALPPSSAPTTQPASNAVQVPGTNLTVEPTGQTTPQGVPVVRVSSPGTPPSDLPLPRSSEEFSTLPPGTRYIDPNGVIGTKGNAAPPQTGGFSAGEVKF